MKKTNMDLIVGGSILLSLIILIGGVLWLKDVSVSKKMVSYTVLFPDVGTLQTGDPVMLNGVNKGSVAQINLRGNKVAVIIELEKEIVLTDSCRVRVENIGLMGERGIGIEYSTGGNQYKPDTKKDTTFIPGYFDTGIAEVMGMVGGMLIQVQDLMGNLSGIINSTVGDSSFVKLFNRISERLDTITDVTQKLVVDNKPLINKSMQNVTALSLDMKNLVETNKGHLNTIIANGDSLSSYSLVIASKIDSLSTSVKNMLDKVNGGQGSVGMLLKDEQLYKDIKRTVSDLDTLVSEVHGDALKLRVKFGFGKKKKIE